MERERRMERRRGRRREKVITQQMEEKCQCNYMDLNTALAETVDAG